ncbi:MAG: hypothetical protein ACLUVM_08595 [Blautia faecis]
MTVEQAPYLPYALTAFPNYNHILTLETLPIRVKILVQDVSSMLVAEAASPKKGDHIIDMCAAPGGKSHPCGRQDGGITEMWMPEM